MRDTTDVHETVWPTLAGHAMGALSPRLAARADGHLPGCERCRERLEGYTAAVEHMTIAGAGSSRELIGDWAWAREQVLRHVQPAGEMQASGER